MARFFRNNGLTIVLMLLFIGSIIGQWLAGWRFENELLAEHGEARITLAQYAGDPQFLSRCSRIGKASSCRWRRSSC